MCLRWVAMDLFETSPPLAWLLFSFLSPLEQRRCAATQRLLELSRARQTPMLGKVLGWTGGCWKWGMFAVFVQYVCTCIVYIQDSSTRYMKWSNLVLVTVIHHGDAIHIRIYILLYSYMPLCNHCNYIEMIPQGNGPKIPCLCPIRTLWILGGTGPPSLESVEAFDPSKRRRDRLDESMEMGKLMGFLKYIVELYTVAPTFKIRREHQLRLVVEIPIQYLQGFYTSQVVIAGFIQYWLLFSGVARFLRHEPLFTHTAFGRFNENRDYKPVDGG